AHLGREAEGRERGRSIIALEGKAEIAARIQTKRTAARLRARPRQREVARLECTPSRGQRSRKAAERAALPLQVIDRQLCGRAEGGGGLRRHGAAPGPR